MKVDMEEYTQVIDNQVCIYIHQSEDRSLLYAVGFLNIQLDISDYTFHPMYFQGNLNDSVIHTFLVHMYSDLFRDHIDLLHSDLDINGHNGVPKIPPGIQIIRILHHEDLMDTDIYHLWNRRQHYLRSHNTVYSLHPRNPLDIFLHM